MIADFFRNTAWSFTWISQGRIEFYLEFHLDLLFTWQGYNKDETNLHKMFSEKRVRGEWFNLNNKDIDTIKNYFEGTSLNVES